jgi:nucleoside-diphosphate-sugar epimerase
MPLTTNILITGASGFIGRHLLNDISDSNFKIKIMTRNSQKLEFLNSDKIEVIQADLLDFESLIKACTDIDCVINLAAEVKNINKQYDTNVVGTKNLVNAVISCRVKKVIHLSSVGVVGMQYSRLPINVTEESTCLPKNGYEETKKESENLWIEASINNQFKLIVLRPTNVFGESHPFKALLNVFSKIKNSPFFVLESNAVVNYIYVKDLTHVINYLITDNIQNGIFNVGEPMLLSDFVDCVSAELNKKSKIIKLPYFLITFIEMVGFRKFRSLTNHVSYSDEKLKHFFTYPFQVKNGIKSTIAHYSETKQLY